MSNIIVAGAGHGGLAAAIKLAKAGHTVTVYEKEARNALGHDWHDRFTFSVLCNILEIPEDTLPENIWEYRGDCAFISPSKRKRVVIKFTDENRQKIMLRKPLIEMLVSKAEESGVQFAFQTIVTGPVVVGKSVQGITTSRGSVSADLVIDAAGIHSPVRSKLPKYFQIESDPRPGDVFYTYRAYYEKTEDIFPEAPFEVYLRHEGEPGLSWFYTADNYVDILIGRTEPLTKQKITEEVEIFRLEHPWFGNTVLNGGNCAVIPVRRPLTLIVADGYAAVGDSAFMTTPMNGMGIDLSLLAGDLLADTVIHANTNCYTASVLWEYNRDFHMLYGGDTAKNEGLKNALLQLPMEGVDFLFEQDVIQAADLSGAGRNTDLHTLLGKFTRGIRQPAYFLPLLNGLSKGSKTANLYKTPPLGYDISKIIEWNKHIKSLDI